MNKAVVRIAFLASTLAGAFQLPLRAEPPVLVEGLPTILVPYGDLDLTRAAGQATLDRRVRGAADRLCATDVRGVGPVMAEHRCLRLALGRAQAQVDRAIAMAGSPQFAQRESLTLAVR